MYAKRFDTCAVCGGNYSDVDDCDCDPDLSEEENRALTYERQWWYMQEEEYYDRK